MATFRLLIIASCFFGLNAIHKGFSGKYPLEKIQYSISVLVGLTPNAGQDSRLYFYTPIQ